MSTDLTNKNFPNTAEKGAFHWLFEGFRTRARDAARFVRIEAAWRTWPNVLKVSQAIQEALTTPEDIAAVRTQNLHDYARRLATVYPTGNFPYADDPVKWRKNLCHNMGIDPDQPDTHGIEFEDVWKLYQTEYAAEGTAKANPDEIAYSDQVDGWEALNQAVGGDLYSNPEKLAVMRRIDEETDGASWEEFHSRVVAECASIATASTVSPSLDNS